MKLKKLLKNETRPVRSRHSRSSRKARKYKIRHIMSIYFGVPGAGKTTFAAWLAKRDMKRGGRVWSNVPITGTYVLDPQNDIGKWSITDGRVIIDEAGIEYDARAHKTFAASQTKFYKYHRHNELSVDIFSQGYNDMDLKLRTLAQRLYVVKRTLLPWFIKRKRIAKRVGINELSKEIIDEYFFVPLSTKYIFAPAVWKLFNTLSRDNLPEKKWEKW